MTTSYLSFASIAKLHNNQLLNTSTIGELSNKSRTYAKDPGVFSINGESQETVLYNFLAQKDAVDIVMPQSLADVQINISNWLYGQANLGNITSSSANTLALLQATFSETVEIEEVGEMATNNIIWLPSFIRGYHVVGEEQHIFYLWFADRYFRTQYPVVSFTIVHPIPLDEIDTLVDSNYQQINARFARETPDIIEDRTHALTNGNEWPYTERNVVSFPIIDLINRPEQSIGYWTVLSWGNGADSEDQLLEQIKKEILEASQYPEAIWEEKIPDLFNPIEFYVLPYFDRLGLLNLTNGTSTLSPIVDRETMMDLVDHFVTPFTSQEHVIKSTQVVPFLYKSMACAFVAKLNNRAGTEKVTSQIPGYQLRPSTDPDFDDIPKVTTDFILHMEELLAAAEMVTPFNLTPAGITRVTRLGKLCVARRIGKVKYIVVTRYQYIEDGLIES